MRPLPMAPMLIRLLGAFCPKTDSGTIVGKPETKMEEDTIPWPTVLINPRRDDAFLLLFNMAQSLCKRRFEKIRRLVSIHALNVNR
jgi:hypothetical protein